jgi:multiple sugar transport system ATP-binding protein
MSSITAVDVSKTYPEGKTPALKNVSLGIEDGEFMVLVGPSGCGKTTLLRSIAGLEGLSSGAIHIGDQDVTGWSPQRRNLAMVFQNYALYPQMTVADNLAFGLRSRKVPKAQAEARVREVAEMLGLTEFLGRKPGQLSGGQRQRVAMGRAISREPAAYLMDEPLSNLDAKLRAEVRSELARLHGRLGVTTVYVTHDQIEAMTLGQRVAVMRDGVAQQVASPQALYHAPANVFVAGFIGSPTMNLVEAVVEDGFATFAGIQVPLSGIATGRRITLGFRADDLHLTTADSTPSTLCGTVDVVEALGADAHVVFYIDAASGLERDADESDGMAEGQLLAAPGSCRIVACVDGRESIHPGETARFELDPRYLHVFDAETGDAIPQAHEAATPATGGTAVRG